MLKITNLNINIDQNPILENISLEIQNGDVVCILGQNGQGKSTLLKAIMGLHGYTQENGTIIYNNNVIDGLTVTERAKIGIFLANQNPIEIDGIVMLDFYKSILETNDKNVNFLKMYKKIEDILKIVKLSNDVLKRYVNVGFSGGEKKKNEIVQMLLLNPELILLDEIDSGLDIDTVKLIINIINTEISNKKTVIYISHSKQTIDALKPNKVILLHGHKIVASGGYELAQQITNDGYTKTLTKLGIKETKQTLDACIGGHFEK